MRLLQMVNEFIAIQDIRKVISHERLIPTIVTWNRLRADPVPITLLVH